MNLPSAACFRYYAVLIQFKIQFVRRRSMPAAHSFMHMLSCFEESNIGSCFRCSAFSPRISISNVNESLLSLDRGCKETKYVRKLILYCRLPTQSWWTALRLHVHVFFFEAIGTCIVYAYVFTNCQALLWRWERKEGWCRGFLLTAHVACWPRWHWFRWLNEAASSARHCTQTMAPAP